MCQRATCPDCGRPTFVGCGQHVESVLGDVPPAERCQCHLAKRGSAVPTGSAAAGAGGGSARSGLLETLKDALFPKRR